MENRITVFADDALINALEWASIALQAERTNYRHPRTIEAIDDAIAQVHTLELSLKTAARARRAG